MKITPIFAGQNIPAVRQPRVPGEAFTGLARGFAILGQGLEQASGDWYHIARYEQVIEEKKKQFDRVTKTLELTGELKTRVDDLHREIGRLPSTDNPKIPKYFERQKNLISNEMRTKALQAGSDVYDLFNRESIAIWTAAGIKTKEIQDLKWRDEKVAELDSIQNRLEEDAAKLMAAGKDPRPAIQFYDALIRNARDEGIISSVQLEKRRETLSDRINANLKTFTDEIKRQQEKEAETRVYTLLKMEFGTNYGKILEKLDDPAYLKANGLTVEKGSNLKNIIKNEQARFEEEKKARQDKTAGDLYIRFQQNQLTYEDIEKAWRADNLSKADVRALGNSLRQHIEQKTTTRKTDPAVYASLVEMVYDTTIDRQVVKNRILGSLANLSTADADALMRKIEEKGESVDQQYYKKALDVLKSQIIPKRGIMQPFTATPDEQMGYYKAISAFDKMLADLKSQGKPLRGKEILDKAIEIAPGYRKSMFERIEAVSKTMKEEAARARAVREKKEAPAGPPKAGVPMTDAQIKKLLEDNGYQGTAENIKIFKANNGL